MQAAGPKWVSSGLAQDAGAYTPRPDRDASDMRSDQGLQHHLGDLVLAGDIDVVAALDLASDRLQRPGPGRMAEHVAVHGDVDHERLALAGQGVAEQVVEHL